MKEPLNILILSCGTRNKIIQYFKAELAGTGKVMAADCSSLAPALYEADNYFIVPHVSNGEYLEAILEICKNNKIKGVLTLIDSEISLLAMNKKRFLDIGTIPIVSNYDMVETCLNKVLFNRMIEDYGFKNARTYIDRDSFNKDLKQKLIEYPVFVKPIKGSASVNISKVETPGELEIILSKFDDLIIQEYMSGTEMGVDAYVDMVSGELTGFFVKEKIKMRAGETDKAISVNDRTLQKLTVDFVRKTGIRGVIDIDVFKVNEDYYISEVNPRFGGGYPHAYECGINIPKMILNNIVQVPNSSNLKGYKDGISMVKYNDVLFLNSDGSLRPKKHSYIST